MFGVLMILSLVAALVAMAGVLGSMGKQSLTTVGRGVSVSADGAPVHVMAGVTIDWTTVAAASSSDVTLTDGSIIPANSQYLRYGQVLTMIGVSEVQTITLTGGPTAGVATMSFPAPASGDEQAQSFTVAYNATAAAVQASLEALSRIGPGGATVTRSGAGSAGDPYVYTVTFDRLKGDVPAFTLTSHTFTGGTTPTVTIATTTAGNASGGAYGPYDPSATDGRATISRDTTVIVNETICSTDRLPDYPFVITGGKCWSQRIIMTNGTHTLAAGPTVTELRSALPLLELVS